MYVWITECPLGLSLAPNARNRKPGGLAKDEYFAIGV